MSNVYVGDVIERLFNVHYELMSPVQKEAWEKAESTVMEIYNKYDVYLLGDEMITQSPSILKEMGEAIDSLVTSTTDVELYEALKFFKSEFQHFSTTQGGGL